MATNRTILNTIQSKIVKFGDIKNLKSFCNSHPGCGHLPEGVFSRSRKMDFRDLFNFILYPRTKSTDIELLEYSHLIGKPNVNKSDFSQRRSYVPESYFRELNKEMIADIYGKCKMKLWKGRIIAAVDGTTYSVVNNPEIKEIFLQGRKTGNGEQALARGIVFKDPINDIVLYSNMECYGEDEISLACGGIDDLPMQVLAHGLALIFDRKYCAYTLLAKLLRKNIGFIIRVKERFNVDVDKFMKSRKHQEVVDLHPSVATVKKLRRTYGDGDYTTFRVRLVRLSANVVVMTNLDSGFFSCSEEDPYHLRWDDETTIGFFKNNLQVEIFSGQSYNAIQQDFHAKTIIYNVLSALCQQAAILRHDDKDRRINRNIALGILRLNAILVLTGNDKTHNTNLHSVLTELLRFTVAVKKGRSNPRVFRKIKYSGKYITLQNYRRAI